MKKAEKFEAKLNLYLIKERQNQCAGRELLERNGRSWKSEKPGRIVKELRAGGNGWGELGLENLITFSWGSVQSQIIKIWSTLSTTVNIFCQRGAMHHPGHSELSPDTKIVHLRRRTPENIN